MQRLPGFLTLFAVTNIPLFNIEISSENGVVRIAVSGELDVATAPQLDAALQKQPDVAARVVLDLSRVSFMDSTGLRVLLQAHDVAQARGRQLTIVPSDSVTRVIRLTGLAQRLLDETDDPSRISSGTGR